MPGLVWARLDSYVLVRVRLGSSVLTCVRLCSYELIWDRLHYLHHGREETLTDAPVTGARVIAGVLR